MDSFTQLTFGAACGEAILGKKAGRKALIWGAILGTLPDLDVFIPLGSPVDDFVYHRGFSHSLFLLTALSPVFAWLITKVCLLYTSPSPRDGLLSRMPSSA